MDALRWLVLTALTSAVVAFDPSLSNGTCYFGPNQKAADNYIPCGNAAAGVQSCCQARDVCLSSNACFNGQYYVTYLAGCTDQNYTNSACPDKGQFQSQQWVGLVRCHISDGIGEQWGPCAEPDQPKVNKGNQNCACDASSHTAVFTDAATLTNIASLPVSAGNAIAWYSGFEPSTTLASPTATTSSSSQATITGTSASTQTSSTNSNGASLPSPTASSGSSNALSAGAKAGIGVGSAAGFVAILSLLLWLVLWRRRKNRSVAPIKDQIRPSSAGLWGSGGGEFLDVIESNAENHKSWARSELPTEANEVTTAKTSLGENPTQTSMHTPATTYHPYQHSPTMETSEIDGSPAASTSRLTIGTSTGKTAYDKPTYGGPVYEMPG